MCPLRVYVCHGCGLVQLLDVVSKDALYRQYPFVSSGVGNTPLHFQEYAAQVQARFLKPGDFVVEIGGNDGVLLSQLRDVRRLNVDPAENIAPLARQRGVTTITDFFSCALAERIVAEHGRARLVMGNNAVAHIDDQLDLIKGIDAVLAEDGVWVIQAPYLGDIFETLGYGTIYHEHLSYFAVRPLRAFYQRFGMHIFDYAFVPFQGRSIRLFIGRASQYAEGAHVAALAEAERRVGWDRAETYLELAERIRRSRDRLVDVLASFKQQGKRIAAYGAAAKGMSILNYANLTREVIDFCVDGLPEKQGLFTPMSHIPIISPEEARTRPVDCYLLLAWNFRDVIRQKEQAFVQQGGKFIMPIGEIEVF